MQTPHLLKQLPAPFNVLFRPWLFVALGLHAIVLTLPLFPEAPSEPPELEEVTIVQAPPTAVPAPPSPQPTVPSPQAPSRVPVARSPVAQPSRPALPASPTPVPSLTPEASSSPTPTPTPTPSPEASSNPTPSPLPSLLPSPPEISSTDSLASSLDENFPHAENTVSCEGLENCQQLPAGTSVRRAAEDLITTVTAQGYELRELTSGEDTGRKFYEILWQGEPKYYLYIMSTFERGTIYFLRQEPMPAEEIEAIIES